MGQQNFPIGPTVRRIGEGLSRERILAEAAARVPAEAPDGDPKTVALEGLEADLVTNHEQTKPAEALIEVSREVAAVLGALTRRIVVAADCEGDDACFLQ